MHQDTLAGILGVTQSTVSRMERMRMDLDDFQYKKLVEKYGEDDVKQYVAENPLREVLRYQRRRQPQSRPSADIIALSEVIKSQHEEIERLNARIAEMHDKMMLIMGK